MRYGMVIEASRCMDCRACMIACTAENDVPIGKHRNWVTSTERGRFPELSMRIEPEQCHHCDDAPCVRCCPTGASYIDRPGGIVLVDETKCIGCRYCMQACPYNARYFDEDEGVVGKCTFCFHRIAEGRSPACVETCPTKVRTFGDFDDPKSEVSHLLRTRTTEVKKSQAGTSPNLRYVIR